jgi:hypothetical protein
MKVKPNETIKWNSKTYLLHVSEKMEYGQTRVFVHVDQ